MYFVKTESLIIEVTQLAIENRSACHAWHACRRLPTPGLACRKVALERDRERNVFYAQVRTML
jgi:hypothetical protein